MLKLDINVLEPESGIRALWLLYKRGKWGFLEDMGLIRAVVEPAFKRFEAEHVVTERLTKAQAKNLARIVPGLVGAGLEMRLAYLLLILDRGG